jgi:cytochrome c
MNGDPLFFNKIAGALLSAGLLAMVAGFAAHILYHPMMLEKPAYAIGGNAPAAVAATAAPAGPEPVAAMLASADAAVGAKLFKKCSACHTFNKGGSKKVGPNLWNIVGGDKAGVGGFSYSAGLKSLGGTWTFADLNQFLYKPKAFVKGTKMSFAGFKKAADRANIIRFLHSNSDSPVSLP